MIHANEILYRAVQHGRKRVKMVDGALRPTAQCFLDRSHQISVDRASKCGYSPSSTQRSSTDYVCCLVVREVQSIGGIKTQDEKGRTVSEHTVNVRSNPLGQRCLLHDCSEQPENLAHALIVAHPHISSGSTFKRLKESLAQIATWEPNFAPTEPN